MRQATIAARVAINALQSVPAICMDLSKVDEILTNEQRLRVRPVAALRGMPFSISAAVGFTARSLPVRAAIRAAVDASPNCTSAPR